ncbi:glycosyltransferase [Prochlorococcus marinus]|uniref:glycosyltransferase n=1 Tax=Prochlorococcus marinus TaxID=1219 RepID=UPI0022B596D3|nr:glycosyltransferase [Prochlorococcus marinus]
MANFLYANAHSLFDYTNGGCKSIKLILEKLATMGHHVYSVTSSVSNGDEGFKHSINLFNLEQISNDKADNRIIRIVKNGVSHSLVKTYSKDRLLLNSREQEYIFREVQSIVSKKNIDIFIGWGNLLLEESIMKLVKHNNILLCAYLVNPSYKGKNTYLLEESDIVISDSKATIKLYKDEVKVPIIIIPKLIDPIVVDYSSLKFSNSRFTCLFVNPLIKKGLEAFIKIASCIEKKNLPIDFICINSNNSLFNELNKLCIPLDSLPKNIIFKDSVYDVDLLFKGVHLLLLPSLWHESGSRLIYEAYARGIPVMAFNTGGTPELIGKFHENVFESPKVYFDQNNILRIYNWDPNDFCKRISYIYKNYNQYSCDIKIYYDGLDLHDNQVKALNYLISKLDDFQ